MSVGVFKPWHDDIAIALDDLIKTTFWNFAADMRNLVSLDD
ncbi:hypothetical protein SDC9_149665 [bioreactor metagenome]|uniref:Uncharacterized protein n=1 Tax=bioreactor metagenome TaxID=1076179 RepID=A0A645EMU8_9ZZZZ